jgi:hypothetical protein
MSRTARRVASDKPSRAQGNNAAFNSSQEGTIRRKGVISQIYVSAHDPDIRWCEGVDREVFQFAVAL